MTISPVGKPMLYSLWTATECLIFAEGRLRQKSLRSFLVPFPLLAAASDIKVFSAGEADRFKSCDEMESARSVCRSIHEGTEFYGKPLWIPI
jgi:hypothetical protein